MHETIAKAKYKGGMRRTREATNGYFERLSKDHRPAPGTRQAWLKWALRVLQGEPSSVILDARLHGKGKNMIGKIIRLALSVDDRWFVSEWTLEAKTFTADCYILPLRISHHLIERIMLRESIEKVGDAMHYLAPSVGIAIALFRHPDEDVLVPCGTGAITMKWSAKHPGHRVMTTYLPEDKLRVEQRRDLMSMLHFAVSQLAIIGRDYLAEAETNRNREGDRRAPQASVAGSADSVDR